jgi:hypothetical protein
MITPPTTGPKSGTITITVIATVIMRPSRLRPAAWVSSVVSSGIITPGGRALDHAEHDRAGHVRCRPGQPRQHSLARLLPNRSDTQRAAGIAVPNRCEPTILSDRKLATPISCGT